MLIRQLVSLTQAPAALRPAAGAAQSSPDQAARDAAEDNMRTASPDRFGEQLSKASVGLELLTWLALWLYPSRLSLWV